MIEFKNGARLVQDVSELPNLRGSKTIYLDLESTGRDPKIKAVNPWKNCWIAGVCITADRHPGAWYVPVGHADGYGKNLPREAVIAWLRDILDAAELWVNHNIKFDAHLLYNDFGIDTPHLELRCTLTSSKMKDSDRMFKGGYGLDKLSKYWLEEDISEYEAAMQPYLGKANKDYGRVPADVMAPYGCQDVMTNRRLDDKVEQTLPEDMRFIINVERRVTRQLIVMERRGVTVCDQELRVMELKLLDKMLRLEEEIQQMTGMYIRPNVNADCFDLLCNHYGLPVLSWTEGDDEDDPDDRGNPSFDKEALKKYLVLPTAPTDVIEKMMQHRFCSTLKGFFVLPYTELNVDGVLHPDFNQLVRTGRMSCKNPNAQQLSEAAKMLIHPRDGYAFVSEDYSQIEYRLIVHFIQDRNAIEAYRLDPDIDFHLWVAEMCGMARKPAKTLNFGAGYGMGMDKTCRMISVDKDIMQAVTDKVRELITEGKVDPSKSLEVFHALAYRRAVNIYENYHQNLPTLKPASKAAARAAKLRGYVRTLAGRRRHLTADAARLAFNSCCQGSASDIIKERMGCDEIDDVCERYGAHMLLQVHDELLFEAPVECAREFAVEIGRVMEDTSAFPQLRVPMRVKAGMSVKSWADVKNDEFMMPKLTCA